MKKAALVLVSGGPSFLASPSSRPLVDSWLSGRSVARVLAVLGKKVVKECLNPSLKVSGIVACRVDGRTRHALDVVEKVRERFGSLVFKTVIRENVKVAEAYSFVQPITEYDPKSAGAEDHRALAAEVIKQEGRKA